MYHICKADDKNYSYKYSTLYFYIKMMYFFQLHGIFSKQAES